MIHINLNTIFFVFCFLLLLGTELYPMKTSSLAFERWHGSDENMKVVRRVTVGKEKKEAKEEDGSKQKWFVTSFCQTTPFNGRQDKAQIFV